MNSLEKFLTHNTCIISIEVTDDPSVMKVVCKILDFLHSPNKWGITEEVCDKYKDTLIGKHFVTRYYSDTDTLGNHEDSKVKFRGTDIDIPHKNTNSIGTVLKVWIDYIDKDDESLGKCLWCEGMLMVYEHMNEISLIQSWLENGIKVNLSIEWFYTESVIVDGIEWIANPTFSNICVLNSEAKNDKPLVKGNYDIAELEFKMIEEMNNAILADYSLNNKEITKESEEMLKNRFLEALNSLSAGDLWNAIYDALSKVMVADEFYDTYISDYDIYPEEGFFVYHVYTGDGCEYYKVTYTKDADDVITLNYDEKEKVVRKQVWVTVAEAQVQIDTAILEVQNKLNVTTTEKETLETKVNELETELTSEKESKIELTTQVESLNSIVEELKPYKENAIEQELEQKLNEKKEYYKVKFEALNALETFETEDVQGMIKETLNSDSTIAEKAELGLGKTLIEMVKPIDNSKTTQVYTEMNSNMNNLIPADSKEIRRQNYGF